MIVLLFIIMYIAISITVFIVGTYFTEENKYAITISTLFPFCIPFALILMGIEDICIHLRERKR